MKNYVLVLGASGNIGGKIVEELLQRDAQIGVVGRDHSKLQKFEGKAELLIGDFSDDAFMRDILQKATSLFLTVPDKELIEPEKTALRISELLKGTSVKHIVNISNSIISRGGVTSRLVAFENELNKIPAVHIKHLRCGNFFENLNWGINTPYNPDLKLPYISSYEVAHVAASYLYLQNFRDKSVDVLLGGRDYSMKELAEAAGVCYEQQPYSPENISYYKPFNDGEFEVENRVPSNTSKSSNKKFTLEHFLENDLKL